MTESIQRTCPTTTRIIVCVGGSIAAYKILELVRRLRQAKCPVHVVMTSAAERFVTPLAFQALSGQPTRTTLWDAQAEQGMSHIALARWATDVIVAPATADLIARLAHGLADDLVTTLCLATRARLWVVPAMNPSMWLNPATQANVERLQSRGILTIGPDDGLMAEDEEGPGRMAEPISIVSLVLADHLSAADLRETVGHFRLKQGLLTGMRCVISAGPTFEDIDPVRYLGNRSSGKMGFALAASAAKQGAEVVLVTGPVHLPTPLGVKKRIDVRSALQMRDEILAAFPTDIFIGAAAIADYMPAERCLQKIKKTEQILSLKLVRTPDILAEVAAQSGALKLVVGFAAETHDIERYAREKLETKHLDLIIANQVGKPDRGFENDNNAATAFWRDGQQTFAHCHKTDLADQLVVLIAERLHA